MAARMCLCQRVPLCVYVGRVEGVSQAPGAASVSVMGLGMCTSGDSERICISASN